jgi:hypothetical protein
MQIYPLETALNQRLSPRCAFFGFYEHGCHEMRLRRI